MIDSSVLDYGLILIVQRSSRLLINSAVAVDYMTATDLVNTVLGVKYTPAVIGPQNAVPSGRRVIVQEISDGAVSKDGRVAGWALVDDNSQRCLASGPISTPLDVVIGNAFTLEAFSITLPGVA
jgi:hypothetical protein